MADISVYDEKYSSVWKQPPYPHQQERRPQYLRHPPTRNPVSIPDNVIIKFNVMFLFFFHLIIYYMFGKIWPFLRIIKVKKAILISDKLQEIH